jgi:nitrate/nitrite-specific signal transduction histidine kinase
LDEKYIDRVTQRVNELKAAVKNETKHVKVLDSYMGNFTQLVLKEKELQTQKNEIREVNIKISSYIKKINNLAYEFSLETEKNSKNVFNVSMVLGVILALGMIIALFFYRKKLKITESQLNL